MGEHSADKDTQREQWEAFVKESEARGVCPFSGLTFKRCAASVCDCFREQYPDDPYGLHPEMFVVGAVAPPETPCPNCSHVRGVHREECTRADCGCDWGWDDFAGISPLPPGSPDAARETASGLQVWADAATHVLPPAEGDA